MPAHATIVGNLARAIGQQLVPPCFALVGAGIVRPDRAHHFYVPDLLVTCKPVPRGSRGVPEPHIVIEVLSPGSRRYDRDVKLDGYRALASVEAILFVWSEERRVQLWRRDGPRWVVEDLIGDATLRLEAVDATLPLAAVYDNVVLDEPAEAG